MKRDLDAWLAYIERQHPQVHRRWVWSAYAKSPCGWGWARPARHVDHRRRHQRQGLDRRLHRGDRTRGGLEGRRLHLAAPAGATTSACASKGAMSPTMRWSRRSRQSRPRTRRDAADLLRIRHACRAVAVRAQRPRPRHPRSRPRRSPRCGQPRRSRRRGDHHGRPRPPGLAGRRPRTDRRREGRASRAPGSPWCWARTIRRRACSATPTRSARRRSVPAAISCSNRRTPVAGAGANRASNSSCRCRA